MVIIFSKSISELYTGCLKGNSNFALKMLLHHALIAPCSYNGQNWIFWTLYDHLCIISIIWIYSNPLSGVIHELFRNRCRKAARNNSKFCDWNFYFTNTNIKYYTKLSTGLLNSKVDGRQLQTIRNWSDTD